MSASDLYTLPEHDAPPGSLAIVSAAMNHFPKATDADLQLLTREMASFDPEVGRRAIEQHRLELGARAFRPDVRKIAAIARAMSQTGRSSEAAEATRREIERRRAERADIKREHAEADQILLDAGEAAVQRALDELVADLRAGRVRGIDPATQMYLATLADRKPGHRQIRLLLSERLAAGGAR